MSDQDTGDSGQFDLAASLEAAYDQLGQEEAPQETEAEKEERLRDERGRFAAKPEEQPAQTQEEAPTAEAAPQETTEGEQPEQPAEPVWKPASWKAEELTEWDKAPASVRQAVERREREMNTFLERTAPFRKMGEEITQAIQPYSQVLQRDGVTPQVATAEAAKLYAIFRTGTPEMKLSAIQEIAQFHGIDLTPLASGQMPQVDPNISAIQRELMTTRQQLAAISSSQQERENAALQQHIQSFSQGKPHFEAVRNDMAALIEAAANQGQNMSLEDAYERAVWAKPDLRQQLLAQQDAERQKANAAKVAEAKKAASVNVSSKGAPATTTKPKNWQDGLSSYYDQIVG